MEALKYVIRITEGTIAMVHGCYSDIEEIAVPSLNLMINKTGIHVCDDIPVRTSEGKGLKSITLDTETEKFLTEFAKIKIKEREVLKKLNLERKP